MKKLGRTLRRALTVSSCAAVLATSVSAQTINLSAMTDADKEAFGAAVRSYLLENPEVIMEAVQALENRQAAEQAQADIALVRDNAGEIFNDGYSWVGGNPDGDITVVEFLDYRCGYCRRAHPEVTELVESDGNIRLVVKEFPILGDDSMTSSRFALAVREVAGDEAYKAAHEALIALKNSPGKGVLVRLSETLGVDSDAVLAAMESPEVSKQIERTRELARTLSINGTPTFVMGGQLIRGYLPLASMQQVIAEERG